MNHYATGDDITIEFYLRKNGLPIPGGLSGSGVEVALLKPDRTNYAQGSGDVTATILDATTCKCSATWERALTGDFEPGDYIVEAQVTKDGAIRTYPGGLIRIVDGSRPT